MVAKLEVVAHHRRIQPDMMAGERVRGLSAPEAVTEVDVASIYAVIEMVGLSAHHAHIQSAPSESLSDNATPTAMLGTQERS